MSKDCHSHLRERIGPCPICGAELRPGWLEAKVNVGGLNVLIGVSWGTSACLTWWRPDEYKTTELPKRKDYPAFQCAGCRQITIVPEAI
jgi:hypothetical protein